MSNVFNGVPVPVDPLPYLEGRLVGFEYDFSNDRPLTVMVLDDNGVTWAFGVDAVARLGSADLGARVRRWRNGVVERVELGTDRVLRAVYTWCAMAWVLRTAQTPEPPFCLGGR